MKVCGIELKSNNCILTLIDVEDEKVTYIDLKAKKIILDDDEKQDSIHKFIDELNSFIKTFEVEKIFVKKRAKRGNFAGGAVTFKMEALIQALVLIKVELVSSSSISSYEKKNSVKFPSSLKKYQEQAYLTALVNMK